MSVNFLNYFLWFGSGHLTAFHVVQSTGMFPYGKERERERGGFWFWWHQCFSSIYLHKSLRTLMILLFIYSSIISRSFYHLLSPSSHRYPERGRMTYIDELIDHIYLDSPGGISSDAIFLIEWILFIYLYPSKVSIYRSSSLFILFRLDSSTMFWFFSKSIEKY